MPDVVSPSPSFSVHQDDAGTVSGAFAVNGSTVKAIGAINWAALLQAVVTALPAIIAIINAFAGSTPPQPLPPAMHEVKP